MQEAVLLQADVDERGFQAGEDVVDLALVDVADDRAVALALQIQLGDPVVPEAGLLRRRERARALDLRDAVDGVPLVSSNATRVSPRSTLTNTCFFNCVQSFRSLTGSRP